MLRHVGHRPDQRRAGDVGAPGVVPLHVRHRGGKLQPPVRQLDDARPVRLDPGVEIGAPSRGRRLHVAGGQEVDPVVVGEEELRGVEARRGGKAPPARGRRVVRQPAGVVGVVREELRPAGVAGDGGDEQHLLARVERLGRLARGEGERAVRDRGALGEAARAAAVDRLDQREGRGLDKPAGKGGVGVEHNPAFRGQGLGSGVSPKPESREPAPTRAAPRACVGWCRTWMSSPGDARSRPARSAARASAGGRRARSRRPRRLRSERAPSARGCDSAARRGRQAVIRDRVVMVMVAPLGCL